MPDAHGTTGTGDLEITEVDPQGADALELLRQAAVEVRALYPECLDGTVRPATNPPTPPRGIYLVAYVSGNAAASGALRPLSDQIAEVRRMFVTPSARRKSLAFAILRELERQAAHLGYSFLRLETGNRQLPAMALYAAYGFTRIEPFGEYANDPTSVCLEKAVCPNPRGGD